MKANLVKKRYQCCDTVKTTFLSVFSKEKEYNL